LRAGKENKMKIEDCKLFRFQVSGFGCQQTVVIDPETLYETTSNLSLAGAKPAKEKIYYKTILAPWRLCAKISSIFSDQNVFFFWPAVALTPDT